MTTATRAQAAAVTDLAAPSEGTERVPVLAETDKPEPGVPFPPFPPPFPVHSTMVARSPCSVA
ncbi:MAG: hypothetical protein OXF33_05290, partial [Rhodospirillales bacterium]|nr:hypothetical protein [Rhodospirillales bacterium]